MVYSSLVEEENRLHHLVRNECDVCERVPVIITVGKTNLCKKCAKEEGLA